MGAPFIDTSFMAYFATSLWQYFKYKLRSSVSNFLLVDFTAISIIDRTIDPT